MLLIAALNFLFDFILQHYHTKLRLTDQAWWPLLRMRHALVLICLLLVVFVTQSGTTIIWICLRCIPFVFSGRPSMLCLHFCTENVWHWQRAGQGKCWRQRASRDSSYYNREAEDEHCMLLVMLPLAWDTGHHDLDWKQNHDQSLDSSPTTGQEILAGLFIGEDFTGFSHQLNVHGDFFKFKTPTSNQGRRSQAATALRLIEDPWRWMGHWAASSSARALSCCHWDWHPCKS